MSTDVRTAELGTAGFISLNKPSTIHALDLGMVRALTDALLAWKKSNSIKSVIVDHAEGRGFCAGGDISMLRKSALEDGGKKGRKFFHDEYQLNHLLFTYPKPVIAFMDGITMGGGVGISQPASFRINPELRTSTLLERNALLRR